MGKNKNKNEYTIQIKETLRTSVQIFASSEEEAISIARKNWEKGDYLVERLESVCFEAE